MKVLRLLLRITLILLILLVSAALGAAVFYAAAPVIDSLPLLATLSLVLVALVSGLGVRWVTGHGIVTGATFFGWPLLLLLIIVSLLRVPSVPPNPVPAMSNMKFWSLVTGSQIAYTKIPAHGTARATPIVFLHGGPGWLIQDSDIAFYGQLAKQGFDVYLFDQVGSGRSSRLEDKRQYSTARLVADLEAIRIALGSDKLILIGQSWGNTLAVDYVAAHPDRVAKLIFSSPGAMWDVARFEFNYSRVANVGEDPGFTPPQMAALLLAARNSIIATQIMSEPSLAAAADAMPASVKIENNYCAGAEARIPMAPILGSNPYVNRLVFASQKSYPDPRPSLRDNATPALIMRGECDFVPLAVAQEYLATFPQARLVQFSGAGHALYAIHPSEVLAEITGFLGN